MEINNPINVFKKLGYDHSVIAEKLLGEIGKKQWIQLTIRTKVNRKNECLQYQVLLARSQWLKIKVIKGDTLVGVIKPYKHARGTFWMLKDYKVF